MGMPLSGVAENAPLEIQLSLPGLFLFLRASLLPGQAAARRRPDSAKMTGRDPLRAMEACLRYYGRTLLSLPIDFGDSVLPFSRIGVLHPSPSPQTLQCEFFRSRPTSLDY